MSPAPLILLPPSEGKASGGDGPPLDLDSLSFEELNPTRERVAKILGQVSERPRTSQKLLGVKGTALAKAMAENVAISGSATLPAIERYTGVMYDAIDYQSLGVEAKECFGQSTIIMSGLFGMVRPYDMIPAYKLKMGGKLPRGKTCSAIWKPVITKSLAAISQDRVIWDLLPNEHGAAWNPAAVKSSARYTVKFLNRTPDGELKTVNHWSKLLKGALVRHLVSNPEPAGSPASALKLIADFTHPEGYEFRPEMTIETNGATEIILLKDD